MKKFLKIYFLLAILSSALLWIGLNNGGYFSYKVREQLNTKHTYDVNSNWNDEGGSNSLTIKPREDKQHHDKVEFYKLPLAIVADFLTAPLQVLMGVGLWILLILSGVKC